MTSSIPNTQDSLLTRGRTAEALTEAGFPRNGRTRTVNDPGFIFTLKAKIKPGCKDKPDPIMLPSSKSNEPARKSDGDAMTDSIPDNPDALLTRCRTAEALTAAGFPIKAKTLATKATRGGGPPFSKFGLRVLYRWGDALAWAQGRLTAPHCNTSEQDARSAP
jgi:hypothetical protein